jgi:hypothetical protein
MSSNKRARTRAIRAEMATSGESYSRAAHAATTRAARPIALMRGAPRRDAVAAPIGAAKPPHLP